MSDDDDEEHTESDANLFDGSLDGQDTMGFGPLVPTENERSLMERVRHELKHELKQVKQLMRGHIFKRLREQVSWCRRLTYGGT